MTCHGLASSQPKEQPPLRLITATVRSTYVVRYLEEAAPVYQCPIRWLKAARDCAVMI